MCCAWEIKEPKCGEIAISPKTECRRHAQRACAAVHPRTTARGEPAADYTRGCGRSAGGSCARGRWAIRVDRRMAGCPSRSVARQAERSAASSGQVSWSMWNCLSALQKLWPYSVGPPLRNAEIKGRVLFLTLTWEEECFLNPITTALRTVTNGYKRFHTRISPRVSPSSTCVHWSILYPLSGRLLGIAPGACAATLVVLSLVDIILLLSKLI